MDHQSPGMLEPEGLWRSFSPVNLSLHKGQKWTRGAVTIKSQISWSSYKLFLWHSWFIHIQGGGRQTSSTVTWFKILLVPDLLTSLRYNLVRGASHSPSLSSNLPWILPTTKSYRFYLLNSSQALPFIYIITATDLDIIFFPPMNSCKSTKLFLCLLIPLFLLQPPSTIPFCTLNTKLPWFNFMENVLMKKNRISVGSFTLGIRWVRGLSVNRWHIKYKAIHARFISKRTKYKQWQGTGEP